uniref:Uncharacterized protein n=1 Tax=Romanomermis culicivorax TaxID=13658 RepID=A0A915L1S0_ROMCU
MGSMFSKPAYQPLHWRCLDQDEMIRSDARMTGGAPSAEATRIVCSLRLNLSTREIKIVQYLWAILKRHHGEKIGQRTFEILFTRKPALKPKDQANENRSVCRWSATTSNDGIETVHNALIMHGSEQDKMIVDYLRGLVHN